MDLNGNQIIAVDFDGTLCKQAWPEIGEANTRLIDHLRQRKAGGARLILWTNREGGFIKSGGGMVRTVGADLWRHKRKLAGNDRTL